MISFLVKKLTLSEPRFFSPIKLNIRRFLERYRITVSPVNFYSSIPSIQDIEDSFEYKNYQESAFQYDVSKIFDKEFLIKELEELIPFAENFIPDDSQQLDPESPIRFTMNNTLFSHSDAMAYFAYICKLQPRNIVEIGSGFSSLVAIEAVEAINKYTSITCIEPFPRLFLNELDSNKKIKLLKKRIQDIDLVEFNNLFEDGDVLFIDSTHTVKTGSDCLHIYLRLLPFVTKKIYIHIHDIFLPYGMPKSWLLDWQAYFTEQYLVLAWLTDNFRSKVLYGSSYHMINNPHLLNKLSYGRHKHLGGGSLWISYNQ